MKYLKVEVCDSIEESNPYYFGSRFDDSFILKVTNLSDVEVKIVAMRFLAKGRKELALEKPKYDIFNGKFIVEPNSFRNISLSKDYINEKIGNLDFKVTIVEDDRFNLYDVVIENSKK